MTQELKTKRSPYERFVDWMSRVGEKLPSPFVLFLWLFAIVAVITTIMGLFHASVTNPVSGEAVAVQGFLSADGLSWFFTSFIDNVMDFPPFGLVLVIALAVGICEASGFFPVLFKKLLMNVPSTLLTAAVIFFGMLLTCAGDAGIILVPTLAGLIFYTVGKSPVVGILAGYAATAGTFGANVIPSSYDALLYPLTNQAAATIDPTAQVSMLSNWFFFGTSCILFTIVGTFVTVKFIEPRFGNLPCDAITEKPENKPLSDLERKGLRNVLIATLVFIAIILVLLIPHNGWLRGENGGIISSPFMEGLPFVFLAFFSTIGIVYGFTTKVYHKLMDVADAMGETVASLKGFIVTVIAIAQLVALFNWSNLGTYIALSAYNAVSSIGLNSLILLIALVIITMIASLFISSASALWSIFAPMFVPTFMLLGFSPAVVQAAFRVGSPVLSIISPFMVYIPMIITMVTKYTKKFNIGQLLSAMIPYSIFFLVVWIIQLIVWVVFNIPLGPDGFIYL